MSKFYYLAAVLLLICNSGVCDAQKLSKKNADVILSNFNQITENLYFGKCEVSNIDYKEFLSFAKNENERLYTSLLPDTAQWLTRISDLEPMAMYYFQRPQFNNYPVVNISYEDALSYCKWLTDLYNQIPGRKFKKVNIRLPSEKEWESAARGIDNSAVYPFGRYLRNSKGEPLCNYLRVGDEAIAYDESTKQYYVAEKPLGFSLMLTPIDSYGVNYNKLYNMSGNAAEMVMEKGLAKGGSFMDPGYNVRINSRKYYLHPEPTVGFRMVLEVVEP